MDFSRIVEHQPATPIIAAIEASGKPSGQLAIPCLKVLENPTIETYREVFGPILAVRDAAAARALKKNLVDYMNGHQATRPLAAAIAAGP